MTMSSWVGPPEPEFHAPGIMGWIRVFARGLPLACLVFGSLVILLLLRLLERPLFGPDRPWTPHITVFVCRNALRILSIGYRTVGTPNPDHGAMVANHSSWLDIFVLNAGGPLYFVSKSEVAGWPGIGALARATGTIFIERNRNHARAQTEILENRLLHGHRLLFFPEGTSTDGLQVIPFKTTLFASFLTDKVSNDITVQPVSVVYHAPPGTEQRFYGWWGDMSFGGHLLFTLAARRQGHVEVVYHAPLNVSDFADRKSLAAGCEKVVRKGHYDLRHPENSALQ